MKRKHQLLADKHTETFPPEVIAQWRDIVWNWDENHARTDPYHQPETCELGALKI
jgi:hypothetical protein